LRWVLTKLITRVPASQEGYLKMEEYVAQSVPGFFSSAEAQIPPAQLKKLKNRCKQTARMFWYDWRTTLESDTANKLQTAAQYFEIDLSKIDDIRAKVAEVQRELSAAMPPPASAEGAALVHEKESLTNQLAQREATLVHAESACTSLRHEVARAEQELDRLRGSTHTAEQQLHTLSSNLSSSRAAPDASHDEASLGEDILDALQVAQPSAPDCFPFAQTSERGFAQNPWRSCPRLRLLTSMSDPSPAGCDLLAAGRARVHSAAAPLRRVLRVCSGLRPCTPRCYPRRPPLNHPSRERGASDDPSPSFVCKCRKCL
jgi:hypothetical protein